MSDLGPYTPKRLRKAIRRALKRADRPAYVYVVDPDVAPRQHRAVVSVELDGLGDIILTLRSRSS